MTQQKKFSQLEGLTKGPTNLRLVRDTPKDAPMESGATSEPKHSGYQSKTKNPLVMNLLALADSIDQDIKAILEL